MSKNKTVAEVGQVRIVRGHGLMLVVEIEEEGAVAMLGHGCKTPHWFPIDQLTPTIVTAEVIAFELAEARARKVDCNSPGCWCRRPIESGSKP